MAGAEDARQVWIADQIARHGWVTRDQLAQTFGLSVLEARDEIDRFLREHPDCYDPGAGPDRARSD